MGILVTPQLNVVTAKIVADGRILAKCIVGCLCRSTCTVTLLTCTPVTQQFMGMTQMVLEAQKVAEQALDSSS